MLSLLIIAHQCFSAGLVRLLQEFEHILRELGVTVIQQGEGQSFEIKNIKDRTITLVADY